MVPPPETEPRKREAVPDSDLPAPDDSGMPAADGAGMSESTGSEARVSIRVADSDMPAPEAAGISERAGNEALESIRFLTWNVHHLSDKTRKHRSMDEIVAALRNVDFVALQEIHNATETLNELCEKLDGHWDYIVSNPYVDRTNKRCSESLAFLWRTKLDGCSDDWIRCTSTTDKDGSKPVGAHVETEDGSRPAVNWFRVVPFWATFAFKGLNFVVVTCHLKFSAPTSAACSMRLHREERPRTREDGALAYADATQLEVDNLAIAHKLIREQWEKNFSGRDMLLLLMGDFNRGVGDPHKDPKKDGGAFHDLLKHCDARPLLEANMSTMVRSAHGYDNIFYSWHGDSENRPTLHGAKVVDLNVIAQGFARQIGRNTQNCVSQVSDHCPVSVAVSLKPAAEGIGKPNEALHVKLGHVKMCRDATKVLGGRPHAVAA